jgi:hypothetical protein
VSFRAERGIVAGGYPENTGFLAPLEMTPYGGFLRICRFSDLPIEPGSGFLSFRLQNPNKSFFILTRGLPIHSMTSDLGTFNLSEQKGSLLWFNCHKTVVVQLPQNMTVELQLL